MLKHRRPPEAVHLPRGGVVLRIPLEPESGERCVPAPLSPAQLEIAGLAARGLSDAAIAEIRGCSKHTVSNLLRAAFRRLGVGSRAELTVRVASLENGTRG